MPEEAAERRANRYLLALPQQVAKRKFNADNVMTAFPGDKARRILVASPSLIERVGGISDVEELADLPTLAMTSWVSFHTWELIGPNGAKQVIRHQPRLTCRSMTAILDAARAGLGFGFGLLLESACENDLQAGKLVRVLPEWQSEESEFYIVFTTAKGMPPAGC